MAATLENPSTVPCENEQAWDEVGAEYPASLQKLDFSSSQLVMKLLFPKIMSLLCCKRSLVGWSDMKLTVFTPVYSVLHFVVHSADDSHSFISFL